MEVRKAQALETLQLVPPTQVVVSAQENEPNDDGLNTNAIPLGKRISAAIAGPKDADVFAFETPGRFRDVIVITLENRSTTLEPRIELFNAAKVSIGHRYSSTAGSDLDYRFVSEPSKRDLVRVSNYYGASIGGYHLEVRAAAA